MKTNIYKITAIFIAIFLSTTVFSQPDPPSDLSGSALRTWLKTNWYDGYYTQLGYNYAREQMYGYVDKKPDGQIYCVYTQFHQAAEYVTFPDPINAEHTVPQSWFSQNEPMRGDIFHLYPTHEEVNNARGDLDFAEITDNQTDKWYIVNATNTGLTVLTSIPTSNIDAYSELNTSTSFEPREDHKGDVARSAFYFYTVYPTQAGSITDLCDINTLYQWHLQDPVDEWELQRNDRIEEVQGNRNPYIDHPEIVCRAWGLDCGDVVNFTSSPLTSVQVWSSYFYNITFQSTSCILTCTSKPEWLTFNITGEGTATLSGIPNSSFMGSSQNVVLSLTDGTSTVTQEFAINVTGPAYEITSTPVTSVLVNNQYTYNITYTGINADLTCPVLPEWLTFNDNGNGTATLQGTPAVENLGNDNVELLLSDGFSTDNQDFLVNVYEGEYAITSSPLLSLYANELYVYNITYIGDGSALNCLQKPDWLFFNDLGGGTAILTGTPTNYDLENNLVSLELTGGLSSVYQDFEILIMESNYDLIFNKDFNDNSLTSGGWKSFSIVGNGQIWNIPASLNGNNGTYCGYIYGFSAAALQNEDWLISPMFVPDNYSEKILTFWTSYSSSGENIKVYHSENYAGGGDPNNAIWNEIIGFSLPSSENVWTSSENINISDLSGTKSYIAFKYLSTTTAAKAWKLDDIKLEGIYQETEINTVNQNFNVNIYPNPFTDNFSIEFELTENSNVVIDLLDVTGRMISNIYSGYQTNGLNLINCNSDMLLTSGIYFISIKTDNQNVFKKIILNK